MQGPALGRDVRRFKHLRKRVHGILCAPPCTDFSRSGARWWEAKGERPLLKSLAIVDACCRIVLLHKPRWWVLENPLGRLSHYLGPPVHVFQPCDFGDHFTKKTALWGDFNRPFAKPVKPTHGSLIAAMGDAKGRARRRSITPPGFAQAFFEANP
jgi:site-specific DNA-cytosine methylase